MKLKYRLLSLLSRLGKDAHASSPGLFARFLRDEAGSVLVYMTLAVPVLIGIAGLGTEGGFWLYKHRVVQSAADNAAYSAAAAYIADNTSDLTAQARAITANDYNLVDGVNGVTVTVSRPPSGSCYNGTSNYTGANAIEVIVTQPVTPLLSQSASFFSHIALPNIVNICGRAVAIVPNSGDCVLALGTTGTGIDTLNNVNNLAITLTNCSIFSNSTSSNSITMNGNNNTMTAEAIGAAGGIILNGNTKSTILNPTSYDPPVTDPYASEASSWPQSQSPSPTTTCPGCGTGTQTQNCTHNAITTKSLTAGTFSSQPNFSNCVTVTMASGTYIFSQGLTVPRNTTLNIGAGSTIIIPSTNTNTPAIANSGTVQFGGGSNSIYIGAGGWTDNSTATTAFGNGNFSMAITGGWTINNNLTMGTGSYSVSVTKDIINNLPGDINLEGATSTMGAGDYYISGNFNINGSGGQTVAANDATLILTGANSIVNYTANNATFTLTAPTTTGWNQGIAIWEPNSIGTNQIASGNSAVATIKGVIYAPKADVQYAGNTGLTPVCTQIVAKQVEFGGNSINLTGNCSTVPGVKVFGQIPALVE